MSFFTRKHSTGEILKRLLCTHCERKIREEIQTGRYFHDMCVEMTDNRSYWAVEKYARKACLLCRFALAILQDDGTPLSVTSEGMPPERAKHQTCAIQLDFIMPSGLLEVKVPKGRPDYQVRLRTFNIPPGTQYTTHTVIYGAA
ncbi:hypothetical protein BTUL_0064g00130 [Botrytis tulipae]|uniref:Uncharacterized protein n=1 Tax=Botrytis tulipae TaxID=87230 RepID=A0A4Z1ETF3_9HELO|nr:hypothetical protein BTUL_0064g00130 [Botrytis tulipae]